MYQKLHSDACNFSDFQSQTVSGSLRNYQTDRIDQRTDRIFDQADSVEIIRGTGKLTKSVSTMSLLPRPSTTSSKVIFIPTDSQQQEVNEIILAIGELIHQKILKFVPQIADLPGLLTKDEALIDHSRIDSWLRKKASTDLEFMRQFIRTQMFT